MADGPDDRGNADIGFDRLRLVVDSMCEGFGLLAPDFTILELNDEAMRLDTRSRAAIIGRSHWDVYPHTEHSEVGRHYKRAMAERVTVEFEHCYHWEDGRVMWLETRAFPTSDGNLAVFYRDITTRVLTDQQLRESEARFAAAVDAVDGVMWTNTADGEMRGPQPAWGALTGQSETDYRGFGWTQAVHPDDVAPTLKAWRAALAAGTPFVTEHRVRRHDGEWRLFAVRAVPVRDDAGAVTQWVGVHRDVTQNRTSDLRLTQLAETIDAVFYVHEFDERRISYVSRAYEQIWGRSRDELYADPRNFMKSVHRDDLPRLEAALREQAAGRSTPLEYRLRRDDGSERIISDRPFDAIEPVKGGRRVVGLATDITDIRRAQAAIEASAQTFASLVKSNPFGIYVIDADFKLFELSVGARPAFGNVEPLIGRDFAEIMSHLWPEPFASETIARFRHTLATGEPYANPRTVERRSDKDAVEAYDWRIERIVLPDGRFGVVCFFYDLSERERWSADLEASRARETRNASELEALYGEAPLGLAMIDADLRFVRINHALAEMNGFAPENHIGKSVWDLVPALRASAEPPLRQVLDTGEALRNVVVTGETAAQPGIVREWVEQFYPVRDDQGQVIGIGVVAEEVTERRRQEKALRDSEDELRCVLDQLFAFVGILTPDGKVAYANQTPLIAAGIDLATVAGRPFEDAPWWSYDPAVQDRLRTAIAEAATGKIVRYDVPVQLGGTLATIDFQLAPLRDHDGTITGLIPSGVVIEERVRAEAALYALTAELELQVERRTAALNAANAQLTAEIARREAAQEALLQSQKLEAMGRLVAGVSHDFNNILAGILSGVALLDKKVTDPVGRQVLEMSASAANRGAGLVRQLLAFARQQPLAAEVVDVAALLAEVRPLIDVSLPSGVMLTIDSADDCGAVLVDPAQMQSALLNLAINARDAMPDGGRLTLAAHCEPSPDRDKSGDHAFVVFRITDTGTGMSPEVLARVAEPFFTTKGVGKGTGLGVAMVHGFVTQSGGRMEIESKVGVGTTVKLLLPRSEPQATASGKEPDHAGSKPGRRILVVDDDRDLRGVTCATLIDLGHDVLAAEEAEVALTLLTSSPVDLVLTDVAMPNLDGVELARRIRERFDQLPILFMTGNADRRNLAKEIVLEKPFGATALTRAIEACIDGEREEGRRVSTNTIIGLP